MMRLSLLPGCLHVCHAGLLKISHKVTSMLNMMMITIPYKAQSHHQGIY